jgi:hypothetical protein
MPVRPSTLQEQWDRIMGKLGGLLFVLQFIVVAWVVAKGHRGFPWGQVRRERLYVYLMVISIMAFGSLWLSLAGRNPDWNFLGGGSDALLYETAARQIILDRDLLNRMPGTQPFHFTAGYRYVLAAIHALMGPSKAVVVLTQYGLLAAACSLVYFLARRFASPAVALLASILFFIGPARGVGTFQWSNQLYPAVTGLLLGGAVLVQLARWRERPTAGRAAKAGALFGLACIARPNFLAFTPIALAWFLLPKRDLPRRRGLAFGLLWLLTASLAYSPLPLRNWYVSGKPTPVMAASPHILTEAFPPPAGLDLRRVGKDQLYQSLGLHPLTQEVLEFLRQRPLAFLAIPVKRALNNLGLLPSLSLSLLAFHLAYILGALLQWRSNKNLSLAALLHGFLLSQFLFLSLFPGSNPRKNLLPIYLVVFPFATIFFAASARYISSRYRFGPVPAQKAHSIQKTHQSKLKFYNFKRRGIILTASAILLLGGSLLAGSLILRKSVTPLFNKALKRTPLKISALYRPTVGLFPPALGAERFDIISKKTGRIIGRGYNLRLSLLPTPSLLHPSLFLKVERIELWRPLKGLEWRGADARRLVRNLQANLRHLPLVWYVGTLEWAGTPGPKVRFEELMGKLAVKEPHTLTVRAQGRLKEAGLNPPPAPGLLRLKGEIPRCYDAVVATGSVKWAPQGKINQRTRPSQLTCQLKGAQKPSAAKAALMPPSSCTIDPAGPENRRFWESLVGWPLPIGGKSQKGLEGP